MQTKKNEITLGELAGELDGELVGESNITVVDIRDIEEAGSGDLAFTFRKKSAPLLEKTKACCVVVPADIDKAPVPLIKCKNLNLAFKKAVELILPETASHPRGIHKSASIGKDVKLGSRVALGAYVCLEDNVEVSDGTVIYAHCYVGRSAKIGEKCVIYPNVTVRENVKIGDRVIIHSGCVIGADGFGYERTPKGHEKIPHVGDVIIEDDVELGACVTVDRAKIAHTKIGKGTKVDNLVQIAHNVTIGSNCIIVAQSGISGSVKIGNSVIMGGQVGLVDHIEIGDNAMIAAQSGIMKSVPPNTIMWGTPARPIKKSKTVYALLNKLPEIYKKLKAIEEKLKVR
ncbi:MAG: UDP-3-O-(3-hydroxymyristoyl)glucosamine N-acyltransferase [Candidatus Omnitrophota bacterium]